MGLSCAWESDPWTSSWCEDGNTQKPICSSLNVKRSKNLCSSVNMDKRLDLHVQCLSRAVSCWKLWF